MDTKNRKRIRKNKKAKINIGNPPLDIEKGFEKLIELYGTGSVVKATVPSTS